MKHIEDKIRKHFKNATNKDFITLFNSNHTVMTFNEAYIVLQHFKHYGYISFIYADTLSGKKWVVKRLKELKGAYLYTTNNSMLKDGCMWYNGAYLKLK